jgi:hypothetical protein
MTMRFSAQGWNVPVIFFEFSPVAVLWKICTAKAKRPNQIRKFLVWEPQYEFFGGLVD